MGYGERSGAVTAIGVVNAFFAGLGVLASLAAMVLTGLFGVAIMGSGNEGSFAGGALVSTLGVGLFGIVFLFCLLQLAANLALLKRRAWGRTVVLVLAFLSLLLVAPTSLFLEPTSLMTAAWNVFVVVTLLNEETGREFS